MIDAACGVAEPLPVIDGRSADDAWLILSCPTCFQFMAVERRADCFDPPTATLMEVQCPECHDGDFDMPVYFDSHGRSLEWLETQ